MRFLLAFVLIVSSAAVASSTDVHHEIDALLRQVHERYAIAAARSDAVVQRGRADMRAKMAAVRTDAAKLNAFIDETFGKTVGLWQFVRAQYETGRQRNRNQTLPLIGRWFATQPFDRQCEPLVQYVHTQLLQTASQSSHQELLVLNVCQGDAQADAVAALQHLRTVFLKRLLADTGDDDEVYQTELERAVDGVYDLIAETHTHYYSHLVETATKVVARWHALIALAEEVESR